MRLAVTLHVQCFCCYVMSSVFWTFLGTLELGLSLQVPVLWNKPLISNSIEFTSQRASNFMNFSVWHSWDRASLMYFFKYNQQNALLYSILYYCQCCTCFRRFLRPSSGAQKLYTQHPVYVKLACWSASKLDIYQMLCLQFLSFWWWAEKPPETCTALTVIKNIV